jgi:hypothetical protein
MSEPEVETFTTPMVCIHSDEGKTRAEEIKAEVCRRLGREDEPVPRDQLVTAVVVSLNWDFDAMITGIPNDMWSAVNTECHAYENKEYVLKFKTRIECDLIEDGIAATWKLYADKFPEKL